MSPNHPAELSVLFVQSGARFAADAQVHASLMRHLGALGVESHALCVDDSPSTPSVTLRELASIDGVGIRRGRFGPVFTSRRPAAVAAEAVRTVPATIATVIRTAWWVRRRRVAVVHCTEKARESLMAYAIARLGGARLVVHLHVKVEAWFHPATRWAMRRADRLIAISEFVGGTAVASGYEGSRVAVVLNGASPRHTGAARADRAATRAELGIVDGVAVVLIVARLNPWKGHRELIDALADVSDSAPPFVLLVVGDADLVAAADAAELRALATRRGIADRVRFLGFREDVPALMAAADVFAMPSFEEPFGLVFVEAMQAGLPVVALDNGGTPEVVEHRRTGLLSAPGDRAALVAHLGEVLASAELRAALGAAGKDRAADRFGAARMSADMAAVYRDLVGAR